MHVNRLESLGRVSYRGGLSNARQQTIVARPGFIQRGAE